jgi:hypothetical protein
VAEVNKPIARKKRKYKKVARHRSLSPTRALVFADNLDFLLNAAKHFFDVFLLKEALGVYHCSTVRGRRDCIAMSLIGFSVSTHSILSKLPDVTGIPCNQSECSFGKHTVFHVAAQGFPALTKAIAETSVLIDAQEAQKAARHQALTASIGTVPLPILPTLRLSTPDQLSLLPSRECTCERGKVVVRKM